MNEKVCTEEEMFEEHLDEEYQNSEIDEDFAEYQRQLQKMEEAQFNMKFDKETQNKLEKAITLIRLHIQNYQRIIVFNRRRSRQRLKRRQSTLRNFFLLSLKEMQIRFVEMLPLTVEPQVLIGLKNKLNSNTNDSRNDSNEIDVEIIDFYRDVAVNFTDAQWTDTFHMPRYIFNTICSRLKILMEEEIDMDFESWIAMCIYTISTGTKFSSVGMLFNVEKMFVRQSLYKFVQNFLQEFSKNSFSLPQSREDLEKTAKAFLRASNIYPCVGVLHIFQVPNQCTCGRYYNCGSERIIVQVCIDDRLLFRKVEIANTKLTMFLKSANEISVIWKTITNNALLQYFIAAPPEYPLRSWLMQKYKNPREFWEHDLNKSFDNLNIFKEVSMKALFGRWQILSSTECIPQDKKSLIIKACCLLHNLLEENGEIVQEDWTKDINFQKFEHKIMPNSVKSVNEPTSAFKMRDEIAKLIGFVKSK